MCCRSKRRSARGQRDGLKGFDANSLLTLAKALRGFDVTAQLGKIKSKVLYVLSRTDKLFPPELAASVMPALKAAGVDADYFLLDSEYGHSASGLDAHKWAPRLREFMEMPLDEAAAHTPAIMMYLISTYSSMP